MRLYLVFGIIGVVLLSAAFQKVASMLQHVQLALGGM